MDIKDEKWHKVCKRVAMKSRFGGIIIPLLENDGGLGRDAYYDEVEHKLGRSNCHGTVRHVLGQNNFRRPRYFSAREMAVLLEGGKVNRLEDANVIAFWGGVRNSLQHTAVYVGYEEPFIVLFHQPNTGESYDVINLDRYLIENPGQRETLHRLE